MKRKIVDINTDKEKLEELRKQFPSIGFGKSINNFIRRNCDGMCDCCFEFAVKQVKFQVGDKEQKATRIERYCQKHFELIIKKQIQEMNEMKFRKEI